MARHLRTSRRPYGLVTPRDFDLSPYFEIVKFSLIEGARVPAVEPEPKPSYARRAVAAFPILSRFRRSPSPSPSPTLAKAPATTVIADHALRSG